MAEAISSSAGGLRFKELEHEALDKVLRLFQSSKSLFIFTVGKTGAGKSSLVGDILGPDAEKKPSPKRGMQPATMGAESFEIPVGDVSVKIYDTRGMFDGCGGNHESETLRQISQICRNDVHGVLLVCIEMHQRLDKSTLETLALIHKRFGKEIWRCAVIALTKADRYPTTEWLESKKWWQREEPILKKKFEEDLSAAKKYLKSLLTGSRDVASECYIGLTEEEFEQLEIPILPASQLSSDPMSRMEVVGHESWFDTLLVACCRREGGIGLVKIHSKRLSHLPKETVATLDPTGYFGQSLIQFVREVMKSAFGKTALIVAWKVYWSTYSSQLKERPRFEEVRRRNQ